MALMAAVMIIVTVVIYIILHSSIQAAENRVLTVVNKQELNANKNVIILLFSGVAGCLLLLYIFYQMILRNARLREKTEADLLEAKNIAEAANKAKTTFLATMSHEIRTPMHDIIGSISLLAETPLTDEQQKYTGTIQRSSMALLAVVNDIIDFSHIESGKIPLENSPFVLGDCLNEVFAVAGNQVAGNKVSYHIDENLPALIECDAARLRQVLMSVAGDTFKTREGGEIECSVRLLSEDRNVLEIEFNVSRGGSLANELVWTEGEIGKDSLFGMSAIRFSIAARLVSLMGGNIKVFNETGQGHRITFIIKATRVDKAATDNYFNRRKDIQWLDNEQGDKIPLRMLVVDDHEMNQVLLVQILTKMGYTCKTARNGVEAAGMAIEEKFDIIFMDIVMPVMDGVDATKRIREYYVNTDTPLIVGVTANALLQEKQRGFDAGMNDFLIKPYKPADIKKLIEKWTALVFKLKYEL